MLSRVVRRTAMVASVATLGLVAACSGGGSGGGTGGAGTGVTTLGPEPAGSAPHSHKVDGDGTTSVAAGYRLEHVSLPRTAGQPGRVTFQLLDASGHPVTSFIDDQTEKLHLYVVSQDLQDFRHLHPTEAADGTWSGRVDLADPGAYRVITEFIPAPHTDLTPVVLGATGSVGGPPPAGASAAPAALTSSGSDGIVSIAGPTHLSTGFDQQVDFVVSDGDQGIVNLGTYLGAYAHLTAFDLRTGAFVHAHPLGEPTPGPDGSTLTFHITLNHPDDYRLFMQVRVDGFLHTIALGLHVS